MLAVIEAGFRPNLDSGSWLYATATRGDVRESVLIMEGFVNYYDPNK